MKELLAVRSVDKVKRLTEVLSYCNNFVCYTYKSGLDMNEC